MKSTGASSIGLSALFNTRCGKTYQVVFAHLALRLSLGVVKHGQIDLAEPVGSWALSISTIFPRMTVKAFTENGFPSSVQTAPAAPLTKTFMLSYPQSIELA
jgi:hypothetical protein